MNKKYLFVAGIIILVIAGILIYKYHRGSLNQVELLKDNVQESPDTMYSKDSSYYIIFDTPNLKIDSLFGEVFNSQFHVWETKSHKQTSSVHLKFRGFKCLALHPTEKMLAFLSDYSVETWDLVKGILLDANDEENFDGFNNLEFSDDGRYLLVLDYRDAEIKIFQLPGLKYLATGNLGVMRNDIWWESKNGREIFYYKEFQYVHRTEFPADSLSDPMIFTPDVIVDSLADNSGK
jgi:WD40 repeat protein